MGPDLQREPFWIISAQIFTLGPTGLDLTSPLFWDSMNVVYELPWCLSAQWRTHEDLALSKLGIFAKIELTINLSSATQ